MTFAASAKSSVLLLGNYRPALAIARSLQPEGYNIIQGLDGDEGGCETSRFVAEAWDHPPLGRSRSGFLAALEVFLSKREDIGYVYPVSEEFVHAFAYSGWTPPQGVTLVGPDNETIKLFSSKQQSLELARRIGVATLPFAIISDHRSMLGEAEEIGYPIVVRPLGTTARLGHKKAVFAGSAAELLAEIPDWPVGHDALLLQGFASGARHNVYFAARKGKLIADVESRILRTNHPDGTGLAVSGVTVEPTPVLAEATRMLVQASSYTGIGLAQFMHDPQTGRSCFIELNPRISGSHAVPELAGVPLSRLAMELSAPTAARTSHIAGRTGLRYVWLSGDIIGIKNALKRREVGLLRALSMFVRSIIDALRADIHMVFRRNDPLPGLRALAFTIPKLPAIAALARQPVGAPGKKHPG